MSVLGRGLSAEPAELLSITERARYLLGLRLGLAGVVISVDLFTGGVCGGVGPDRDRRFRRALARCPRRSSDVAAAPPSR